MNEEVTITLNDLVRHFGEKKIKSVLIKAITDAVDNELKVRSTDLTNTRQLDFVFIPVNWDKDKNSIYAIISKAQEMIDTALDLMAINTFFKDRNIEELNSNDLYINSSSMVSVDEGTGETKYTLMF